MENKKKKGKRGGGCRRFFVAVIAMTMLLCGAAYAEYAKSSGEQTSSAIVSAGPCLLTGAMVITDGTNDATLTLYDNASTASGTVLAEIKVVGADNFGGRNWAHPAHCYNGVYAAISGTGASYIVEVVAK